MKTWHVHTKEDSDPVQIDADDVYMEDGRLLFYKEDSLFASFNQLEWLWFEQIVEKQTDPPSQV